MHPLKAAHPVRWRSFSRRHASMTRSPPSGPHTMNTSCRQPQHSGDSLNTPQIGSSVDGHRSPWLPSANQSSQPFDHRTPEQIRHVPHNSPQCVVQDIIELEEAKTKDSLRNLNGKRGRSSNGNDQPHPAQTTKAVWPHERQQRAKGHSQTVASRGLHTEQGSDSLLREA